MTQGIKTRQYILRIVCDDRGTAQFIKSQAKIQGVSKASFTVMKDGEKSAAGLGTELTRLGKRAALTIPIWFLLRGTIMAVINSFGEGYKSMIDFDIALQKAKQVISGSVNTIEQDFNNLKATIEDLSRSSGRNLTDITNAFYQFGTLGIPYEEAIDGMRVATNMAISMFGDVDQIAKMLAQSYKLLGDTMQSTGEFSKMEVAAAKMKTLWKDNAFEIDGFTQAMNNFLPTANSLNMTYDQMVALLATLNSAAVKNGRSGTLLRQSFNKLLENMGKIPRVLGLAVNPELENTYDIFKAVLGEIDAMASGGQTEKAAYAVREIFGGTRSGEAVRAVISLYEELNNNQARTMELTSSQINTIGKDYKKEQDDIQQSAGETHKRITKLIELNKQQMVQNLTGALGWEEALLRVEGIFQNILNIQREFSTADNPINKLLTDFVPEGKGKDWVKENMPYLFDFTANPLSKIMPAAQFFLKTISGGIDEEIKEVVKIFSKIKDVKGAGKPSPEHDLGVITVSKDSLQNLTYTTNLHLLINKTLNERKVLEEKAVATAREMSTDLRIRLNEIDKVNDSIVLSIKGYDAIQIAEYELTEYIKERVNRYNAYTTLQKEHVEQVKVETVLTLALKNDWEAINQLGVVRIFQDKELEELAKKTSEHTKERLETIRQIANETNNVMKKSLSDVFQGKADFGDMFNNIAEQYRKTVADSFAEGFVNKLNSYVNLGEVFGLTSDNIKNMFATPAQKMETAFETGGTIAAEKMEEALSKGFSGSVSGDKDKTSGGEAIIDLFKKDDKGYRTHDQHGDSYQVGQTRDSTGKLIGGPGSGGRQTSAQSYAQMAVAAYNFADYVGNSHQAKGSGNVWGSAGTGAMYGASAGGTIGGGYGAVIGAVIGGIIGGIQGGKSKTVEFYDEHEFQIASAINISNNKLDMVNRNLVALKTTMESYILPGSSYFGEKNITNNLESQFAINSQRGFS